MSHWGCNGSWRNYGAAAGGNQQQTCTKCGKIRNTRVTAGLFHSCSFPVGRPGTTVECGCGATKRIPRK